ncbi:MAG: PQQ-like beta-propeller repeat protein [Gemmataceae bacterium]|nr:PQQ-like beta-propeller repeat protein [Gemmataceae bacterium]MDW8264310.1 PQQ-binding-like beta-propeller repeat protein [Gemmataceae bacterium]
MRSLLCLILTAAVGLTLSPSARADDWPQWLGPQRDSVWRETGLMDRFPANGLPVKWRVAIAGGYAGPAVADGRVFVTDYVATEGEDTANPGGRDQRRGKERILCLDAANGTLLWKHEYDCPYHISYSCGPRCTPTVHAGKVYTLGAEGNLLCLEATTGKVVWSKDLKQDYRAETPMWGFCGHPLVDGRKLICLVGGPGSVAVAFDKDTGAELWKALTASEPGYCPPTIIQAGGKRQLLIWPPTSLYSLDPETGKEYWSQPLEPNYGMSIMAPRQLGNILFASGIGHVGAAFKLAADKPAASVLWRGDARSAVYCANSTPFLEDGLIYGIDCDSGALRGVELATGKRLWETFAPIGGKRLPHGTAFLVKNGDRFVLMSETGHLILARLSRQGYDEISRAKILEPTGTVFGRKVVWSHPAFANRCVYARNDKELVCVSLAK